MQQIKKRNTKHVRNPQLLLLRFLLHSAPQASVCRRVEAPCAPSFFRQGASSALPPSLRRQSCWSKALVWRRASRLLLPCRHACTPPPPPRWRMFCFAAPSGGLGSWKRSAASSSSLLQLQWISPSPPIKNKKTTTTPRGLPSRSSKLP
jgi:hypothetical protein